MNTRHNSEIERLSALARREFSHAHMSDTKWRKMFAALKDRGLDISHIIIKFTDVERPCFINSARLVDGHPYLYTFEVGPVEFRAIEWLEFPAIARVARANNLPALEIRLDLEAIAAALNDLGKCPFEMSADGLRVLGYSR